MVLVNDVTQLPQVRGREGWKITKDLGLSIDLVEEWDNYVGNLSESYIFMRDNVIDSPY